MNTLKATILATLLFSSAAGAVGEPDTVSDSSKIASKVLQADGITDGRIVDIVEAGNPLVFTYCREGSSSLMRYEVMSSGQPDDTQTGVRATKSQAVDTNSNSCKFAS